MSIPLSSPRFSIQDDSTSPEVTDPDLSHVYSRLNGIDSNVLDIRSSVITKDNYADRRNREDQHIRREFDAHRAIYTRIDVNVVAIRSDVDQLKSEIFQVKSHIRQSGTDTALLRSDVDHLQKKVDQIQEDLDSVRTSVSGNYVETTRLKASVYQLRTEMLNLHNETSRQLKAIESRMENFENRMGNFETRMRLSDRVRFNSLAHATHAPITPVPMIDVDGSFRWPAYFPKTVWRFWCLKKRSRGKQRNFNAMCNRLLTKPQYIGLLNWPISIKLRVINTGVAYTILTLCLDWVLSTTVTRATRVIQATQIQP